MGMQSGLSPSCIQVYFSYKKLHQIYITRRGPLPGLGELVTFVQVPLNETLNSAASPELLGGQLLKTVAALSCSQA